MLEKAAGQHLGYVTGTQNSNLHVVLLSEAGWYGDWVIVRSNDQLNDVRSIVEASMGTCKHPPVDAGKCRAQRGGVDTAAQG
jgi:hypothetical protein